MNSRPGIFATSIVLLVPFAYATLSMQDACARASHPGYDKATECTGSQDTGKTCCWREPVEGQMLGVKYCQTCTTKCDSKGTCTETCTRAEKQAMERPDLSGPLEEGNIQGSNITTPDSDQKTGIFKDPTENNDTFSQDDIGNIE